MNPDTSATRRGFLRLATGAGAALIAGAALGQNQELRQDEPYRRDQGYPYRTTPAPPPPPGRYPYRYEERGGAILIGPTEDLMREHAVQERILLIYDECGRRIEFNEPFPSEVLADAARLVQRFVEDYHERMEESDVFPRFREAGQWVELVNVLLDQHRAGRRVTENILRIAGSPAVGERQGSARQELQRWLYEYARMYRPHMAREGSELFVALLNLLSPADFAAMAERFEERERFLFGDAGYQRVVAHIGEMEKALNIHSLASYTPGA